MTGVSRQSNFNSLPKNGTKLVLMLTKNKKTLKSIKIPRLVEVSSGFEPLYELLQSSA